MARVNIYILRISELKWIGMDEFNSDDHYLYYCGQESLRNGVGLIVNKRFWNAVLGCNLKNDRMISVHLQGQDFLASAAAKSLQSCLTLCDPIDGSPPGSPVPGILQARTLEWVAISFSNAWKWKVKEKSLSRARLFATPWTAAYQASLSMGFSRQEYWSGVPSPSPRHSRTNTKKRCPFHHRGLECTRFTC